MSYRLLATLCAILAFSVIGKAQDVIYDKTTDAGRTIITDSDEIYEAPNGKEGRLGFYTFTKNGVTQYFLSLSSQEDLLIHSGYKLLLKHKDGTITELTCVAEGTTVVSTAIREGWRSLFVRYLKETDGVLYAVDAEQLYYIENNPVVIIRIEQELEYTDRKINNLLGSRFSSVVKYGHEKIREALATKKTGLYDGF